MLFRSFIGERLRSTPWDPARWLAERQRTQHDLVETLQTLRALPAPERERRPALLQSLAQRLIEPDDPEARPYRDQIRRFQCELAADLHNRTDAGQRRDAADRLQGWARDLRAAGASVTATGP